MLLTVPKQSWCNFEYIFHLNPKLILSLHQLTLKQQNKSVFELMVDPVLYPRTYFGRFGSNFTKTTFKFTNQDRATKPRPKFYDNIIMTLRYFIQQPVKGVGVGGLQLF